MASHTMSNPAQHYRETAKKILTHPVKINTSMGQQTMSLMEADHLVANGHADAGDLHRGFVRAVRTHANPDAAPAAKQPRKLTAKMIASQAMSKVVLKRVHDKLKAQGCNIRKLMFDEWAAEQKRESKYEAWAQKGLQVVASGQATPGEVSTAVGEKVSGEDLTPVASAPTGGTGAKRSRRSRRETAQAELPLTPETKNNPFHRRNRRARHNPGMFGVVENDGKFHLSGPGGETMGKYYMTREKAELEAAKMNARMN
jgi:hypothetical protein